MWAVLQNVIYKFIMFRHTYWSPPPLAHVGQGSGLIFVKFLLPIKLLECECECVMLQIYEYQVFVFSDFSKIKWVEKVEFLKVCWNKSAGIPLNETILIMNYTLLLSLCTGLLVSSGTETEYTYTFIYVVHTWPLVFSVSTFKFMFWFVLFCFF